MSKMKHTNVKGKGKKFGKAFEFMLLIKRENSAWFVPAMHPEY